MCDTMVKKVCGLVAPQPSGNRKGSYGSIRPLASTLIGGGLAAVRSFGSSSWFRDRPRARGKLPRARDRARASIAAGPLGCWSGRSRRALRLCSTWRVSLLRGGAGIDGVEVVRGSAITRVSWAGAACGSAGTPARDTLLQAS